MPRPLVVCLALLGAMHPLAASQDPSQQQKEPEYNGQPLSHWLAWLKDKDSFEHRREATSALITMRSADKQTIAALIDALDDEQDFISSSVARILGQLGPQAKAAIPRLQDVVKSENVDRRIGAAHALWEIARQRSSLQVLMEIVKNKNHMPARRASAALALGEIGPPAKDGVPSLKEALMDEDEFLRLAAAGALWGISRQRAAIPVLIQGLKAQESNTRSYAANRLFVLGPEAKDAVPALAIALADPAVEVRRPAALALVAIGTEAKAAVPALIKALGDDDRTVRGASVSALHGIGRGGQAAEPALLQLLKDPDKDLCRSAARALVQIGSSGEAALTFLSKDLKDQNTDIRWLAAAWLGQMGPAAAPATAVLIEALKDNDAGVRRYAALALSSIGNGASAAVSPLKDLLKDTDGSVRLAAALALWRIDKQKAMIDLAVRSLDDKDVATREGALVAVTGMGAEAKAAIPQLLNLAHHDAELSSLAARALWRIDKLPAAIPILVKRLDSASTRGLALDYLQEIGPDAKAAVPSLVRVIEQEENAVDRDNAAAALRKIDPKSADEVGR
ncbi:MAG TPA: HEAT repeat domain-containing protein [Gemmataceae bacterium]|nr:HEAT repeat domain-containing protein [Gemmataceae bacterium]